MSNTKTNSNAAKDDVLSNGFGTYDASVLLANDAGSAKIIGTGFTNGVTWNAVTNTFTVPAGITEFNYEIATGNGNGTHSIATVKVAAPTGPELVQNWSFEDPRGPESGLTGGTYTTGSALPGWTTDTGSAPLEVVSKGYNNINGDGHWLDTQASPGSVDISQVISGLSAGQHAQMTFSVAAEEITSYGGDLKTDPNEKLDFVFGGNVVKEVSLADFAKTDGTTDFNHFLTFNANVVGGTNNTLQIFSHGASPSGNVGFAIDSVSIKALALPPSV